MLWHHWSGSFFFVLSKISRQTLSLTSNLLSLPQAFLHTLYFLALHTASFLLHMACELTLLTAVVCFSLFGFLRNSKMRFLHAIVAALLCGTLHGRVCVDSMRGALHTLGTAVRLVGKPSNIHHRIQSSSQWVKRQNWIKWITWGVISFPLGVIITLPSKQLSHNPWIIPVGFAWQCTSDDLSGGGVAFPPAPCVMNPSVMQPSQSALSPSRGTRPVVREEEKLHNLPFLIPSHLQHWTHQIDFNQAINYIWSSRCWLTFMPQRGRPDRLSWWISLITARRPVQYGQSLS